MFSFALKKGRYYGHDPNGLSDLSSSIYSGIVFIFNPIPVFVAQGPFMSTSPQNKNAFFNASTKKTPLWDKFSSDINELAKIPFHLSKQRDLAGDANMQRLSTRFTLITLKLSLLSARELHLLDSVEWMMGRPFNLTILDSPLGVYNALSVGLSGLRLLVNIADIIQLTLKDDKKRSMSDRFYEGVKKHHYQMVNDAVWTVVNGLSNYAEYFHIPAPIPNLLMLGFTVFDVLWLNYALLLEKQAYDIKTQLLKNNPHELERLERSHEKTRFALFFYIIAACLMLVSFTAAFLLFPPALLPVCFLVCNIAIAMYLSGDKFGAWNEAHLILKQNDQSNSEDNGSVLSVFASVSRAIHWLGVRHFELMDYCFSFEKPRKVDPLNTEDVVLDKCGLINTLINPKTATADELKLLSQNRASYVLFESKVYYIDSLFNVTEEKTTDIKQLKAIFPKDPGDCRDASKDDLTKIVSLTGPTPQGALDDLVFTMAKNTIAPFIFLGAFTVSVPAAIGLTVAYFAYEQGYFKHLPALCCGLDIGQKNMKKDSCSSVHDNGFMGIVYG